jgi:YD repeat-containing protein
LLIGKCTVVFRGWRNVNTQQDTGANINGYFTTYTYDAVGNLLTVIYPSGTASLTNQYDALDRLTNRLDGLGQTRYSYAVLGNGQRTFTEDGPWASDEVTVTNRDGLRAGLRVAQHQRCLSRPPTLGTSPGGGPLWAARRGRSPTALACHRRCPPQSARSADSRNADSESADA